MLEPPRRLQYAWDQMHPEHMELRMLKMGETYSTELNKPAIVDFRIRWKSKSGLKGAVI